MTRFYAAPVAVHDVRDLEGACRAILDRALRNAGTHYLDPDDYEDFLADFITEAWAMSKRYDPDRVRDAEGRVRLSFSTYLNRFLQPRIADCYRRRFADARYGPPPVMARIEDAELVLADAGRANLIDKPASFEEAELHATLKLAS